ncbi:MAG: flagellar filament outer layer protein FlaA [Treponema sp.]|nr:flagellar filament outer layer protein FlaA [Treponema sp.]
MKHDSVRVVCLILMACIATASGFTDEPVHSFETIILESFDHNDQSQYDWKVEGSKFITKTGSVTYPRVAYANEYPSSLFLSKDGKDANGNTLNSLGINGAFDRNGYNWIDVYPVLIADDPSIGKQAGDLAEIPIRGKSSSISLWVWGANLDYSVDVYVKDYQGIVYRLKLGDLNYTGWRKLTAKVPANIPQSHKSAPYLRPIRLIKFRIWTKPYEQVNDFYVYFDQLTALTDVYELIYDGSAIENSAKRADIWSNDDNGGSGQ